MRTNKSITLAATSDDQIRFIDKAPILRAAKKQQTNNNQNDSSAGIGVVSLSHSKKQAHFEDSEIVHRSMEGEMALLIADRLEQIPYKEIADANVAGGGNAFGTGGLPGNTQVTDIATRNMVTNVIDTIIYDNNPTVTNIPLNNIYRDMYYHDSTSGTVVDLYAKLPWSNFHLSGIRDEKALRPFVESVEAMHPLSLLPKIATEYCVIGCAILSLSFDESKKIANSVTLHDIDYATFRKLPIENLDPKIYLRVSPFLADGLNDTEFVDRFRKYIPKEFFPENQTDPKLGFLLDPDTTIFIPRAGLTNNYRGSSMFRRALPAWFYEKALIRGTIDQVHKRQRGIQHITVEDREDNVVTHQELEAISNLFMSADLDPLGATVVTRSGVSVNDVKRGDDFWRWDTSYDQIQTIKLRSYGISETFITGEVNVSTVERSLSTFLENVRDFRNTISHELFIDKLFPLIAFHHRITKARYGNRDRREVASFGNARMFYNDDNELTAYFSQQGGEFSMHSNPNIDISKLQLPSIVWDKKLMPEGDAEYLSVLGQMREAGVPVTLRHMAAAGGLNLDKIMEDLDRDVEDARRIGEYRQEMMEVMKEFNLGGAEGEGGGGGMFGGGGDEGEGDEEMARFHLATQLTKRKFNIGSVRKTAMARRFNVDAPEAEFADYDSQGHRRVLTRQGRDIIANRFAKKVANALSRTAEIENARIKSERPGQDVLFYYNK